jgi:hypothetical protein
MDSRALVFIVCSSIAQFPFDRCSHFAYRIKSLLGSRNDSGKKDGVELVTSRSPLDLEQNVLSRLQGSNGFAILGDRTDLRVVHFRDPSPGERSHGAAKADLATCFVERCITLCTERESVALVTPQNWMKHVTELKLFDFAFEESIGMYRAESTPALRSFLASNSVASECLSEAGLDQIDSNRQEQLAAVTGVDLNTPPSGPLSELVSQYEAA